METQEFIERFEEKAIKRFHGRKLDVILSREIKESDYQKLKKQALAVYFDDDHFYDIEEEKEE